MVTNLKTETEEHNIDQLVCSNSYFNVSCLSKYINTQFSNIYNYTTIPCNVSFTLIIAGAGMCYLGMKNNALGRQYQELEDKYKSSFNSMVKHAQNAAKLKETIASLTENLDTEKAKVLSLESFIAEMENITELAGNLD